MFEKFTDRARKVMALANQEAQRLNHEEIGTEHILLGLVHSAAGKGVGLSALENLGLEAKNVRLEIDKKLVRGSGTGLIGKLPHMLNSKKVIEEAIDYARELKHNYIGTEHFIYALSKSEGFSSEFLKEMGVNEESIDKEIRILLSLPSKEESAQEEKSKYWLVSREGVPLSRIVIAEGGFGVEGERYFGNHIEIAVTDRETGEVTIKYHIGDLDQVKEAVRLRELLDRNNVKYFEQPSREEVAKVLRNSVKSANDLADRLLKD